jgi:hypothetical protein
MDKEYKKHNGICLKCSDKARIDGLYWWCYQAEYGRRLNDRNRVKTETKTARALRTVWKQGRRGQVQMLSMFEKGSRK